MPQRVVLDAALLKVRRRPVQQVELVQHVDDELVALDQGRADLLVGNVLLGGSFIILPTTVA